VDWSFLNNVLLKLAFNSSWVQRVMACVTSVRYVVRFNGALSAPFTPTRGLRHGDPLLPYLFLFVADGLSKLIKTKVETNALKELKICRGAPGISHLLFADDTLMFFRATPNQVEVVKETLEAYARCTGQLLNPGKCSILFRKKEDQVQQEEQEAVKGILGVQMSAFEAKYLGLPTPTGKIKGDHFQPIKERLGKRLKDYSEKKYFIGS
jgi:hypothetical protein